MGRLTTLKPRVAIAQPKVAPSSGSWRAGKTSTGRGYGYRWQKERDLFLSENPLCAYCRRAGKLSAASIVDHIKPHRGEERLFWDAGNWQPLCKRCHDVVKAAEEREGMV